jgi:starch phosphorylase
LIDVEAQKAVDDKFHNRPAWLLSSILSTAGSGFFSTDRTITQYAEEIWGIKVMQHRDIIFVVLSQVRLING